MSRAATVDWDGLANHTPGRDHTPDDLAALFLASAEQRIAERRDGHRRPGRVRCRRCRDSGVLPGRDRDGNWSPCECRDEEQR